MSSHPIEKPFSEYFEAISPDAEAKTPIKRCPNANDEMCRYPDCACADVSTVTKPVIQTPVAWHPV